MQNLFWALLGVGVAACVFAACSNRKPVQTEHSDKPKPAASAEEINATLADWVDRKVREGFESRAEIIEEVKEIIDDEYGTGDAAVLVQKETDRRLKEHLQEQASWPGMTDCDRIDAAFSALEARGIVARQNFTCCQTCGNTEIGAEIENFAKKAKPRGYTYYHEQDTEGACENGTLYLAYGTVGGNDSDAVEIGNTICDTLRANGLTVDWSGHLDKRICIAGLDWKKRRKPE